MLISLDYNLIKYIEINFPHVQTGYLYFFAIGDLRRMYGDYSIMEELQATDKKVDEIKSAGKKVIVWTINSTDAMNKSL